MTTRTENIETNNLLALIESKLEHLENMLLVLLVKNNKNIGTVFKRAEKYGFFKEEDIDYCKKCKARIWCDGIGKKMNNKICHVCFLETIQKSNHDNRKNK